MNIEFPALKVYPNLNGSSRRELVQQRMDVVRACEALMSALSAVRPHGRDFQTAPVGAYNEALESWSMRYAAVDALKNVTQDEARTIQQPTNRN